MKKVSCKFLIAICLMIGLSSCGKLVMDRKYPLWLQNSSHRNIEIIINNDGTPLDPIYPDTTISKRILKGGRDISFIIYPNQKKVFRESSGKWKVIFKSIKNDTLSFVIFDTDTLNKYPPQVIRQQYNILQRYDLSLQDLQKLNYTLYYPPTSAMKDMKMWPKYVP